MYHVWMWSIVIWVGQTPDGGDRFIRLGQPVVMWVEPYLGSILFVRLVQRVGCDVGVRGGGRTRVIWKWTHFLVGVIGVTGCWRGAQT